MVHVNDREVLANRPPVLEEARRGRLVFLPTVVAGSMSALAMLLPPRIGLFLVAGLTIVWAYWVTLTRGNQYLTPSGIFAIAAGIFLGAGSLYLGLLGSDFLTDGDLRDTAVIVLVTTMATDAVCVAISIKRRVHWPARGPAAATKDERTALRASFRSPAQFEAKGIALVVVSKLPMIVALGDAISPALGLVGILMLSLGFSSLRQRIRWAGDAVIALLALVVPAYWISTVYSGYGRLSLAGMGLAVFAAWNIMRPLRLQKVALVLALPGLLLFMGESRRELQNKDPRRETQEAGVGVGLESVYNPIETLTQITVEHDFPGGTSVGPRYGATFVNTLLLPVPRSWWPGKPKGFGAELTELILPSLVSIGHSMAALSQGEWYANFGWPGLLMMPLAIGWFLARCDGWHAGIIRTGFTDPHTWYSTVTLLCIMSSIGEIFWVGTFTFFNRGGLAAVFAAAIAAFSVRRTSRTSLSRAHSDGDDGPVAIAAEG